jgi:FHA domain/Double zinc ribbon
MTVTCPEGHESQTADYCDQCGTPIQVPPAVEPASSDPEEPEELGDEDTSPAARRDPCPRCGAPRSGDDRFCEACGHDFESPQPEEAAATWELVAHADRDQFERFGPSAISFPADFAERRFPVAGQRLRIGRSRGSEAAKPEIDLAGTPEDPGISRWHATLERQEDGTYVLRDLGSTNGTLLNDDPTPLEADVPVPLAVGDRIRIGAWTTITFHER